MLNRGLGKAAAAAEMGVSLNTLKDALRGYGVHAATAKKIADFCGVLPTDLWPGEEAQAA